MKIVDIAGGRAPSLSFEIFPPKSTTALSDVKDAARRIAARLKARPDITAIMICHRDDEAPAVFSRVMDLDALAKGEGGEWTT